MFVPKGGRLASRHSREKPRLQPKKTTLCQALFPTGNKQTQYMLGRLLKGTRAFATSSKRRPMDEFAQQAIKIADAKKRTTVPWDFDKPWNQKCWNYSRPKDKWLPTEAPTFTAPDGSSPQSSASSSRLALYSWNIDFMLPFPDSRIMAAVRHLESLIRKQPGDTASVLYLQECVESDLALLASDEWVQETFVLSDIGIENWQNGHYGTVTLVDRRLPIMSCFRVHYSETRMERDILVTDVRLGKDNKNIRLCNTHLESLALEPPRRPPQMEMAAKYMLDPAIHGAAVAGDFNAIQDIDLHLHSDNGLNDAYIELGGREDDVEGGHTWGQQAATVQRQRFGTSRMDKIFFCGGLRCMLFERFGADVEVEDQDERRGIVQLGFDKPWITDHLGVMAIFE